MQLLKIYLKYKAKKNNYKLPNDWTDALNKHIVTPDGFNAKIKFTTNLTMINLLTMQLRRNNKILISADWAYELLFADSDIENNFRIVLGHELAHTKKDNAFLLKLPKSKTDKKFLHWVDEVFADFYGTQIMGESSRFKLEKTIKNTIKYKFGKSKNNARPSLKDTNTHPSWNRRLFYSQKYNFNECLIKKIASDTKCDNEKLINKALEYYGTIILE